MKLRTIHKALIGLFAAMFISLNMSASLHAYEYSDAPHEHDGVVCMVAAVADEAAIVLPPVIVPAPVSNSHVTPLYSAFISASCAAPQSRAPPPRGPPTLF